MLRILIVSLLVVTGNAPLQAVVAPECPAAAFPTAKGQYAVGTHVLQIKQPQRSNSTHQAQLWYPAERTSKSDLAPYIPDAAAIQVFRSSKFLDQPDCVLETWSKLKTSARMDGPPVRGNHKFPLIVISPGAGMPRHEYTIYAQQLASDGFVVATVDYGSYGFLVKDGELLQQGPQQADEAAFARVAEDWAIHISDLLDELTGKQKVTDPMERDIAKTIDPGRLATMGHSLGGTASLIACHNDSRLRACVDADGGVDGTALTKTGVSGTALILHSHPLYSDADLEKRHRTREQFDEVGRKANATFAALFSHPGGDAWVLSISGTGHMSFSDAPYTMPDTISRFGGRIIEPQRLFTIVFELLEQYFRHEFEGNSAFPPSGISEVNQIMSRTGKNSGNTRAGY